VIFGSGALTRPLTMPFDRRCVREWKPLATNSSYFKFSVPSLPKPLYVGMLERCKESDLSQWQYVVMGLMVLDVVREKQPDYFQHLIEKVKQEYPKP
jgi:hypothetical protein